ncbi:hypothetical protein SAMN04489730_6921 [Amycolatopsis australiensis]|uniref:Uncharacterized protein n=1 Tax=Amycolatopsis australiensis TaxID=546364 RepID=A0A1K1SVJ5_9PSEU|nr:hypothetical protein SAMN04489730_6921 [Amycolatopsis australiensis]
MLGAGPDSSISAAHTGPLMNVVVVGADDLHWHCG